MHKRSNSFDRIINYKQEKFDPELVFLDKETNLLKVPTTWTRSGFRIINGEQKKIYREHKEKGKESSKILRDEKVSLKPAKRPYLLTESKRSQSKGSEKSRRSSSKKYEPAEFDPSLVYYDSQKSLLKIPSKTAKHGYRFLTENEEESYKAYKLEEEKKLKLIFSEKKPVRNSLGKESATEKEKGLKKEMLDPFTRFIVNYANKQEKAEKPSIKSRSKMRDEDKDGR